jgi:hypothetical protein
MKKVYNRKKIFGNFDLHSNNIHPAIILGNTTQ